MCTVTVIPLSFGIRVACNRDESRERPAAMSPELRIFGGNQALLPIDPTGGGTWIAASEAGLAPPRSRQRCSGHSRSMWRGMRLFG
jgi:hypothetical protein